MTAHSSATSRIIPKKASSFSTSRRFWAIRPVSARPLICWPSGLPTPGPPRSLRPKLEACWRGPGLQDGPGVCAGAQARQVAVQDRVHFLRTGIRFGYLVHARGCLASRRKGAGHRRFAGHRRHAVRRDRSGGAFRGRYRRHRRGHRVGVFKRQGTAAFIWLRSILQIA